MAEQPNCVFGGSESLNTALGGTNSSRSRRKGSRKRPSSGGSTSSSPDRWSSRRKRGRQGRKEKESTSSHTVSASATGSASGSTATTAPTAPAGGRGRATRRKESNSSVPSEQSGRAGSLASVEVDIQPQDSPSSSSANQANISSSSAKSRRSASRERNSEQVAETKASSSKTTSSATNLGGASTKASKRDYLTSVSGSGCQSKSSSRSRRSAGNQSSAPVKPKAPTPKASAASAASADSSTSKSKSQRKKGSTSKSRSRSRASRSSSTQETPTESVTASTSHNWTVQDTSSPTQANNSAVSSHTGTKSNRASRKREFAPESSGSGSGRKYTLRSGGGKAAAASPPSSRAVPRKRAKVGTDSTKNLGTSHATGVKGKEEAAGSAAVGVEGSSGSGGPVLRRSTRSQANTGSCASTSRRTSRTGKLPLPSSATSTTAEGMSSGQGHHDAASGSQNGVPVGDDTAKGTPGSSSTTPAAAGGPSGLTGAAVDSESDDSEVGRLQALLEARGLPPHLLGALGPRVQHLLHRSMGANSAATKAQQQLTGLQAVGDEGQQLQAVIEMCQMLVMGNEDTLAGFPVKQVVPALIALLTMDHNFDIMNHACRALTYMMEALPRSSAAVVEAVPVFLEKLQVIQCMDVAEQSLTALEMLSRRHSKSILQHRGVEACLMYLDFFSINAQRAALCVTANCCQNLHADEFHFVSQSLPLLAGRLVQQDKKSVESVCLAFSRLVDSFQNVPEKLQEIASPELLTNLQQLLVVSPPVISTGTFITVLRMLSIMCANCPDLALTLLRQNIAETLLYLLTGSGEISNDEVELVTRSPQELYEITCLIGELMPRLPSDGIFSVDALLDRPQGQVQDTVQWQWKDDRGLWHAYSSIDSRIIEAAHLTGEDEISLTMLGRTYTVDLHSMQQINEDTGTTRPVQRRLSPPTLCSSPATVASTPASPGAQSASSDSVDTSGSNNPSNFSSGYDVRVACMREERGLAASFIRSLFSVLYEVYSSSAGPSVRVKCLRALLRMVYYASADLLKDVLKNQVVSSHIAGMMASQDLRIVVGALQMADILMTKLPHVFGTHFTREGVMHQIRLLADPTVPLGSSPPKSAICTPASIPHTSRTCNPSADVFNSEQTIPLPPAPFNSLDSQQPGTSASAPGSSASTSSYSMPILCASNTSTLVSVSGSSTSLQAGPSASSSNGLLPFLDGGASLLLGSSPPTSQMPRYERPEPLLSSDDACTSSPSQLRLGDVLKRKRQNQKRAVGPSSRKTRQDDSSNLTSSMVHDLFTKATSLSNSGRSTPNSTSRSRFSGGSSKSFLASLNPARWGRSVNPALTERAFKDIQLSKSSSNPNLTAGNREKARTWVRDQSSRFLETHCRMENNGPMHPATDILTRLTQAIHKLNHQRDESLSALSELRGILLESDVSPFEVNHSGLIKALLQYLADETATTTGATVLHFDHAQRLRCFLHVFAGCPLDKSWSGYPPDWNPAPFSALVNKLSGCVSQLEQFPVKVHDLPAGTGTGRAGTSALKFFNTHQLKCNLQRHPDCQNLKQWKGGTVKIDPLALVQAIERYLVVRGYGRLRDKDTGDSDEENSEDDIDDTLAAVVISQGSARHKLQFLLGEHILPYNMTVYQAVRQFSPAALNDQSETDTDTEAPLGNAGVWVQTHTIYYRPVPDDDPPTATIRPNASCSSSHVSNSSNSGRKGKGSSSKARKKTDELWNEGRPPIVQSPLLAFLTTQLPDSVTIQDASLSVLCLLRVLNALNRNWGTLYPFITYKPIITQQDFVNSKVAAKASRQLQDPLVIMTGNLPPWLQQIAVTCPFLFPFETRQLLLYVTCFDRDRALQRLLDSSPELSGSDSQERVTPRLDRRKRTVSRDDILKQAEQVFQDLATSRALVEIQYENEVGTGLGPTLEFYALVSRELQRADLELWYGDKIPATESSPSYTHSPVGLFPSPFGRTTKVSHVAKVKSKFRFLGKLMAKAVMDSRMLDLPLSESLYRWLLGQETTLSLPDLQHVCPSVHRTLVQLQGVLRTKETLEGSPDMTVQQIMEATDRLELDGCPIADLGLDLTLPGSSNIELRKGGKDITVTPHNLDEYCKLVVHWFLVEGVSRQMEALREGFETVFPLSHLRLFYPEELELIFCGSNQGSNSQNSPWDIKMLMECCRLDHGYTADSRAIRFLFEVLSSYTPHEQRQFLQFITGSPRLPVGGFKSLSPPLTVVRKTLEPNMNPDDFLPSVMTCVNYLKLPDYSSVEVMRAKLNLAAQEGQHSFHLS
ncbi:E3 ubiquitin-protein ligase TRIP12 [Frankliniella occidentalis]|uniref:E3 ubiquitin-protein ligase n=1 Tax=Frankliniella occidentalis TaxID=133901 RepID=A0A6J1TPB9_FRAOC|nr:E3 ubiquitin-protein ligase TRIP12 [Frankliniella occidentalis]